MNSPVHHLPSLPADVVAEYARTTVDSFEEAASTQGIMRQVYRINQFRIELQLCREQLWNYVHPALAHAAEDSSLPADLVIHCWAGEPKPPSPLKWYRDSGTAEISHTELPLYGTQLSSDTIRMALNVHPNTLHLLEMNNNEGYIWFENLAEYPVAWQAAPLFRVLSWWLTAHEHVIVHGSAVGTEAGGFLFVGDSGSGKSTTALACLGSEFGYIADDFCLVSVEKPPTIFCLYNAAKLVGLSDFDRFPGLKPYIRNEQQLSSEKALLMIQEINPQLLRRQSPLKAIIYPKPSDVRSPAFHRVSPWQMLPRMSPVSLRLQPSVARATFHSLARIAESVPCYEMAVGDDVTQIPAGLQRLMRGI